MPNKATSCFRTDPNATGLFVARVRPKASCKQRHWCRRFPARWVLRGRRTAIRATPKVRSHGPRASGYRARSVKVCQAFASVSEIANMAALLERCGFRHTTQLKLLQRSLQSDWEVMEPQDKRLFARERGVCPSLPEFERTLLATHEGTQDCPELNATRTLVGNPRRVHLLGEK